MSSAMIRQTAPQFFTTDIPATLESDQEFMKVAQSHSSADEHQKLAAHYTAHAVEHEADAKTHEQLANQYGKNEPSLSGRYAITPPTHAKRQKHCARWQSFTKVSPGSSSSRSKRTSAARGAATCVPPSLHRARSAMTAYYIRGDRLEALLHDDPPH